MIFHMYRQEASIRHHQYRKGVDGISKSTYLN